MRAAITGLCVLGSLLAAPALANDSTAELGTGGLNLVRNEAVDLLSEDLYLSRDEIRVTYHFRNHTDAPVTYLVAFPLPAVDASTPEEANFVLPDAASDNFVDFAVTVDGKPVTPAIDQHAFALGVDRTDVLREHHLALNPIADGLYEKLGALPEDEQLALNRLGLVLIDPDSVQAAWILRTTFYWEQTFPPGKEIVVEHRYKPVVGQGFFGRSSLDIDEYKTKYCMDAGLRQSRAGEARQARDAGESVFRGEPDQLHPDHRQQLGVTDKVLPAGRRQGRPRGAGQLLRQRREEDLADRVRDHRDRLLARPRARGDDPQPAPGGVRSMRCGRLRERRGQNRYARPPVAM